MDAPLSDAVKMFDAAARQYQEKYGDVQPYHDGLAAFATGLPSYAKVLDVACGPANMSAHVLSLRADISICGIDLAPNMITLAKETIPTGTFDVMDGRDVDQVQGVFDGLLCSFFFPYLDDGEVERWVADSHSILCKGGLLYISTMAQLDATYTQSEKPPMVTHIHTEDRIREVLGSHDYSIIYSRHQRFDYAGGVSGHDLIMIAQRT